VSDQARARELWAELVRPIMDPENERIILKAFRRERDEARAEVERLKKVARNSEFNHRYATTAEAEVARLRAALEFYADDANYMEESSRHDACAVVEDEGQRARAALEGTDEDG